jgi:hypothetical protein
MKARFLALSAAFFLCAAAPERDIENDTYYLGGLSLYAHGETKQALAAFRDALARHPNDPKALAAVRRLEVELAGQKPSSPKRRRRLALVVDRTWLDHSFWWVRFGRTLGDAESAQGSLTALQGKVKQLLAERRRAFALRRRFSKERELRALVRRMPAMAEVA